MDSNFGFFTHNESKVNGRGIWNYMVATPIGNFFIVEYELIGGYGELKRFMFDGDLEKADRKYVQIVKDIASGRI